MAVVPAGLQQMSARRLSAQDEDEEAQCRNQRYLQLDKHFGEQHYLSYFNRVTDVSH